MGVVKNDVESFVCYAEKEGGRSCKVGLADLLILKDFIGEDWVVYVSENESKVYINADLEDLCKKYKNK